MGQERLNLMIKIKKILRSDKQTWQSFREKVRPDKRTVAKYLI